MKKFLLAMGVVAMVAAMSSCSKSGAKYTQEEKELGDSVAMTLGKFAGIQENTKFTRYKMQLDSARLSKFSKEAYLRGLKAVLTADTTQMSYFQGVQMGLQLVQPIVGLRDQANVPVDANKLYEAFKEAFLADSTPDMALAYGEYQVLMGRLEDLIQNRMREAKLNSPEAKANAAAGQAYVEKTLASDAGYQKADDGLVYLITNPGEGEKVQDTDRVAVKYVGKKVDGTIFDQSGDTPAVLFANKVVPGFSEGLKMLGKGGSAVLVIPGELAYGPDGAGSEIGPNETLVFEIEVVDINPTSNN